MENRPRTHSIFQPRPHILQSRATTFLQKISHFRIRLPSSTRKTKDGMPSSHPYSGHSHSIDAVKPYMSQPLLANMRVESYSAEGDDSYSRSSPDASECRSLPGSTRIRRRPAAKPLGDHADITPPAERRIIDGLPAGAEADSHSAPFLRRSFDQSPAPRQSPTTPTIIITNPPASSFEPPPSNNDNPPSTAPVSDDISLTTVQRLARRLSRKRLKSSVDPAGPILNSPEPSSEPIPVRPAMASFDTSPPSSRPAEQPHHTVPLPRRETLPLPRLILPSQPCRRSLILDDGTSARFSPSIILHPPSHPLPTLPTITLASPPSSGEGLTKLRSMPELPQTGSNQDADDGDGEDVEEEDDDENNNSTAIDNVMVDDNQARPSLDSSFESSSLRPPYSTSLCRSHTHSSRSSDQSNQEAYFTPLPGPDTSRIDLSFIDNLLPSPTDRKGKGKARCDDANSETSENNPGTPTSVSPYHDYFGSPAEHRVKETGVLASKNSLSGFLLRTPRPGDAVSPKLPLSAVAPSGSERGGDFLTAWQTSTRPGIYKQASKSMINIPTIEVRERVEQMIREEEEAIAGETNRRSIKGKQRCFSVDVPGTSAKEREGAVSTMVDRVDGVPMDRDSASKRMSRAPTYESLGHVLRRRRSMPTFTEAHDPPPYPSFSRPAASGLRLDIQIQPRDDEGRERLPEYSNGIYMQAMIPRKMEFVSAGVQAKDRKWRKVLCVIDGTALKIYQPPGATGVSAIGEWWERKVGVGDVTDSHTAGRVKREGGGGGPEEKAVKQDDRDEDRTGLDSNLSIRTPWTSQLEDTANPPPTPSRFGFRLLKPSPRRKHARSVSDAQAATPPRTQTPRPSLSIPASSGPPSTSSSRARTPEPSIVCPPVTSGPTSASSKGSAAHESWVPHSCDLLRAYSMQHAESGLGNDYVKRKNVIRVRVEGEQFLLQAKDPADVVAWVEALQASANIALDLDERPMPKGPIFPRRRRRRGRRHGEVEPSSDRTVNMGHMVGVAAMG